MKKRFQTFLAMTLMFGFVLLFNSNANAQTATFTPNTRQDVSVTEMTVLKDAYEQYQGVQLNKSTLLQRLKVSEANYSRWEAVRDAMRDNPIVDENDLQIVEDFVADMAAKL